MSFAQVYTRSVVGLNAPKVVVEVHVSQGLPSLTIVGLPEASVRESKDRVRSAILNSGFEFVNRKLTINLAPADLPKDGARLDLPVAIGILAASGQINPDVLQYFEFIGELSLSGRLNAVTGALAIARRLKQFNEGAKANNAPVRALIVPKDNAQEAARVMGVDVLAADNLTQVCAHIQAFGDKNSDALITPTISQKTDNIPKNIPDLADVKGQFFARRALEIAAAGGHSLLFCGPPGSGKTLMAKRLPSILPPLSDDEALQVASVYSVAGVPYEYGVRPFREAHHTISAVALVGGGSHPKPGEVTLAHKGVLFLDEIAEFSKKTLEVLRQPIEAKKITISRANAQVEFVADFQLVAAMNPCPCGYYGDSSERCRCTKAQIERYQDKLSGPLLDRIDLQINVAALPISDIQNSQKGESSADVRKRVEQAQKRAYARQNKPNCQLSASEIDAYVVLDDAQKNMLAAAQARLNLSARSYHRILRVARTIADLTDSDDVLLAHLAEALSYR